MAGMLLNALINAGLIPGMEGLYSAQRSAPLDAKEMRRQSPHVPPQDDPFEKGGGGVANTFGDIPTTGAFGSLSPQAAATPTAANPVEAAPATAPAPVAASPLPPATEVPAGRPPGGMPVSLPTSAPAPAAAAPAQAPVRAPGGVGNWLNNNSNMLLAMGAGFAGAPSLGAGMSRAFAGAAPFAWQNQTVQALVAHGMPLDMARLAAQNPQALNQILPRLLGAKQWQLSKYTDTFGQEHPILVDPVSGDSKRIDLRGASGGGASTAPSSAPAPAQNYGSLRAGPRPTLDNFDMANVDPGVTGWDYAKQYPEEVEAAARAYMSGGAIPIGNPRQKGVASMARTVAQKIAMDIGNPDLADETTYSARRQLRVDLEKSTPNSMGGILDNGISAFKHLSEYAASLADLGNYSGPNVPFGGHIGSAGNIIANKIAPSPDTKAKMTAINDNALKYGQEATKFYAGTGGGEAERMAALKDNDPGTTIAASQAAFVEKEKQLMLDRLQQKEDHIRRTLGDEYLQKHPVRPPDFDKVIAKIDANVAKLRVQNATPDPLQEARAAISRRAPRDKVIERLQKAGINPAGL